MSIKQSYERVAQQPMWQPMQQQRDPHRETAARRNTHRAWNTAAIIVIWGTSLAVLALWVSGGGVQSVLGLTPETLNSLGRLAGLVSANLLMYQVLLMARIPLFEKGFGRGGIVRAHRFVGMWSVTLLAAPLVRSLRTGLRVTGVRPDGVGGVAVAMRGRKLDRLGAEAGQFFVWRFLDGPGWSRGHPFSLARSPQSGEMQLAARIVGDGTARLASLQPGTRVLIEGPYGTFAASRRTQPGLLMIGAGSGVVPLVAMLEAESWGPGKAVLITRDRDAAHRMRAAEIAWLVAERGLVHIALDGPRNVRPGRWVPASVSGDSVSLLQHLAPQGIGADAFVCGPAPWMDAVMRDLKAAGVPSDRIHHEQFSTEH